MFPLNGHREVSPKRRGLSRVVAIVIAIFVVLTSAMPGAYADDHRAWWKGNRHDIELPAPFVAVVDNGDGTGQIQIDPTATIEPNQIMEGMWLKATVLQSNNPDKRFDNRIFDDSIPFDQITTVELNNGGEPFVEPSHYTITIDLMYSDPEENRGRDKDATVYTYDDYKVMTISPAPPAPPVPPTITADLTGDGEVVPITIDNTQDQVYVLYFEVRVNDRPVRIGERQVHPGERFDGEVRVPFGECLSVLTGYEKGELTPAHEECRPEKAEPTPEPEPEPSPEPDPEPAVPTQQPTTPAPKPQPTTQRPQPTESAKPTSEPSPKVTTIPGIPRPSASPEGLILPSDEVTPGTVTVVPGEGEDAEQAKSGWRIVGWTFLVLCALAMIALILYGILRSVRERQRRNGVAETEIDDDI